MGSCHIEVFKNIVTTLIARFHSQGIEGRLKRLYGLTGFRIGIDLFVGRMAEGRMSGSSLGHTFTCVIGKTFKMETDSIVLLTWIIF